MCASLGLHGVTGLCLLASAAAVTQAVQTKEQSPPVADAAVSGGIPLETLRQMERLIDEKIRPHIRQASTKLQPEVLSQQKALGRVECLLAVADSELKRESLSADRRATLTAAVQRLQNQRDTLRSSLQKAEVKVLRPQMQTIGADCPLPQTLPEAEATAGAAAGK